MTTTEIVLASSNLGKLRELERLFAEPRICLVTLSSLVEPGFEVDETGETFEDNAWLKAVSVCRETGRPALADDSGLEVDALGGRPGVYSARYAGAGASDQSNNDLLLRELAEVPTGRRSARFRCVLALAVPGERGQVLRIAHASGAIEGVIVQAPRGGNGFGYDPLFEPRDWPGKTTAEISPEEKNEISHRAVAAGEILPLLRAWLDSPNRVLTES